MRHLRSGSKLGKQPAHRRAVLRNLVTNLVEKERIHTTILRAKAARPIAEKMITLGKRDSLHARRQAAAFLMTPGATQKLFTDLAPRFAERPGGYTRIIRTGWRIGDGAELAILELIGSELQNNPQLDRLLRFIEGPGLKPGTFLFQPAFCSGSISRFSRRCPSRITSATISCAATPPLVSISTSPTAAVLPGTNR